MNTELGRQLPMLDAEIISAEMISEAVASGVSTIGYAPERALELINAEPIAALKQSESATDGEGRREFETAEEIALKHGVYHEIRRKLNERFCIPFHEIAFIHEADTPARKEALFDAVNVGRVRVLLGSTAKLGTGVNVQQRLIALHHLDEPWKPAELEQREGRILRQGNIYPEVFIFHYVTERSFDGYMLQTLESKARFISQIMAGEVTARTAEDVGDMVLTVAQVKAIASGNPLVQRRIELELRLVKLDRLRAVFYNNRAAMRSELEELPERIAAQEAELLAHEAAIKAREPQHEESFLMRLKSDLRNEEITPFDKRDRAGAHLRLLADQLTDGLRRGQGGVHRTEEVGNYRGFAISIHASGNNRFAHHSTLFGYNSEIRLRAFSGGASYFATMGESNVGITQSIDYQLRHLEDRLEQTRNGLEMLRSRFTIIQTEVERPWTHVAEYRRLRREYETMGTALQAEGVEVETNTTFSAEPLELETENNNEEHVNALEQADNPTSPASELELHRNPFTGLEEWPIIVDEHLSETAAIAPLPHSAANLLGALNLDFAATTARDMQGDEANLIASAPNSDTDAVPSEIKTAKDADRSKVDASSLTDAANWTLSPSQGNRKNPNKLSNGHARRSKPAAQAGFLWN